MTRVLALDIATRTGWAVADDGEVKDFGATSFTGSHAQACYNVHGFVSDLIVVEKPALAFIEKPFVGGVGNPAKQNRLIGAALTACYAHGLIVHEVPPSELKQFATGKGNASKLEMIGAARLRGFQLTNEQDDEADAIHLARYAFTIMEVEAA